MKKIYTFLAVLCVAFFHPGAKEAMACDNSSFTLVSQTALGNNLYEYEVTFCAGGGQYGAEAQTYTWGIQLQGGATFSSYPASLTSPQTGAVYEPRPYGNYMMIYEVSSWPANSPYYWPNAWTCLEANCGPAAPQCVTFTIVTSGEPTAMVLMGAEASGVGVPPYGCNGNPEMVINLNGPVVEAGSDVEYCVGGCATLSGSVSGGTPPYSYYWSNGQTTPTITVCNTQNTLLTLTVIDDNGLVSHDQVSVIVQQPPVVDAGANQSINDGDCALLEGYANGSMYPYTYQWSNGGTTKDVTVCPSTTTTYTLTATDARGCSASDNVTVDVQDISCGRNRVYMCKNGRTACVRTSQVQSKLNRGWVLGPCNNRMAAPDYIEEEDITDEMTTYTEIFPNPAGEQVSIQYTFTENVDVNIEVYDIAGSKIRDVITNKSVQENVMGTETVSVNDFPSGVYFISISASNGERVMHKLMVAH